MYRKVCKVFTRFVRTVFVGYKEDSRRTVSKSDLEVSICLCNFSPPTRASYPADDGPGFLVKVFDEF